MGAETDTIQQPFFFINKTAKSASLSHGKADEAFFIQSYVQSRVRKQKRAAKQRYRKSVSPKITGSQLCNVEIAPASTKTDQVQQLVNADPLLPSIDVGMMDASLLNPTSELYRRDEKDEKCITLDEKTYKLLQYPMSNYIINNFAAESLSLLRQPVSCGPFRHRDSVIKKLERCMNDDMVMYAALASSTSCIRWAVGDEMDEHQPEQYMLKTIKRLKDRLSPSSRLDEWCITCIHDMTVADLWSSDLEAAVAHMKMIKHAVDQFGGLNCLDSYTLENLIMADKYLALARNDIPLLPLVWTYSLSAYDMGAFNNIECFPDDKKLARMGVGFMNYGGHALDERLTCLILDAVALTREAHAPNIDPKVEHSLFLRHQTIFYHLLLLESASNLDEVCRLGLLMWFLKITSSLQAERAAKRLLGQLRESLAKIPIDANEYTISLSLWAITVGARIAEFMKERDWFIHLAARFGARIGLAPEKQDYAEFLQGYFYLKSEEGLQFKRMVMVIRNSGPKNL